MSHLKTLNHIAELLSFTSDTHVLRENIIHKKYDWDHIVKLASQHLVLPTLYYRLKSKALLNDIPEDLRIYLHEISSINKNRNKTILKEIHFISALFIENNITHVFVKGAAFIAASYYEHIGERMIGDIDILVDLDHIEEANQLLIAEKYFAMEQTFGTKYFEHKHLPRLIHSKKLAAIELHKTLLIKPFDDYLDPIKVLKSKRVMNNIYIPSAINLLYHNALNYQINDKGYDYINFSFRSTYDCLTILKQHPEIKINQLTLSSTSKLYFHIISLYFNAFPNIEHSIPSRIKTRIHLYKMRSSRFCKFWNGYISSLLFSKLILNRSIKFILNSNYRADVIKDKTRIINVLKN